MGYNDLRIILSENFQNKSFQEDQFTFAPIILPGVFPQRTVGLDNTMAGDEQRIGVLAKGLADRAYGLRPPNTPGNPSISPRLAKGNFKSGLEDRPLK